MSLYIENENENVKVTNKKNNAVVVFCNSRNRTNGKQSFEVESRVLCNILALTNFDYVLKGKTQDWPYSGSGRYELALFKDSKEPKDGEITLFSPEEDDYLDNYTIDFWVISGDIDKVFRG